MKQNRYSSEKKLFVCLILLILVCIILLIIKTYSTNHETKPTQIVSDEPIQEQPDVQTSTVSSQPEIVVKTEPEITVNHLNNLSDNEASFGELDVPIYKKGQKTLKLPLLIYHAFQTPIPKDDVYKLFSSEQKFDENVKTLIDAGYTFLTLEDIYKYNKGLIGLPEKNVTITMDDGWLGSYTEAFNVLKKYVKLNLPFKKFVIKPVIATGIMGICSYTLFLILKGIKFGNKATIIAILFAVIIYILAVAVLKIYNKEDIYMLPKGEKIYKVLKKMKIY